MIYVMFNTRIGAMHEKMVKTSFEQGRIPKPEILLLYGY